ncbi:MAG: FAD-binding oxidoreductase [Patescibacteria group bacterium]
MKKPAKEVYWYTLKKPKPVHLDRDLVVDIVVVGGGMAGLMCAQRIRRDNKNLKVVVVEAGICGAGASGKSSGFITPDSELELSDLVKEYGEEKAKKLWDFVKKGVTSIKETIQRRNLPCDFSVQDSLYVANDQKGYKKVEAEFRAQKKAGYNAFLFDEKRIKSILGTDTYMGGVRTKDTFGMISYLYCQELKESLQRDSMAIYEETPVTEITPVGIRTEKFIIQADKVVVCTDRFLPDFNIAKDEVYHAQTFLAISEPLPHASVNALFPNAPVMVWDTDLIYQYYRLVEGNRLLLGSSSIVHTYNKNESSYTDGILRKMYRYLKEKFPHVPVHFEYMWGGLIGVSKDFLPIAGRDPVNKNMFFIGACAGLPWAASLGEYIADKILEGRDEFDEVFSPSRKFPLGKNAQVILRKPLTFALSHGIKKYFK